MEIFEEKMKHRDDEFLYNKCIKQYHQLMLSQHKNKEYKSVLNKGLDYIENEILNKKIEEVEWDFDDCYLSDMPAERIKPLVDILKEGEK